MKIRLYFLALLSSSLIILLYQGCNNNPVVTNTNTNPSPQASTQDAKYAVNWMDLLYNAVANQDINPPKASRIYSYCAITLYESCRNGMPNYASLSGQLTNMPSMPVITQTALYDWPSVIAGAMPVVVRGVLDTIFSITDQSITNMTNSQIAERKTLVDTNIVNRSTAYGQTVAAAILQWLSTDNYTQTRTMVYTVPSRNGHPSYWEPTDPVHLHPLEPFWGLIRPFAMPDVHYCDVPMNKLFDTIPGTAFYNDAMEVKTTVANLTQEQQDIAFYWQDKLRTGTPAGHWVSIMNQVAGIKQLKLDAAVYMYAMTCISMADAFISCWEEKYVYNLLRPYTFIRDYIGPSDWESFLPIPPFPEYTSGHSTQSSAAAEMLTHLFGDNFSFTDTTLIQLGFNPRSFASFYAARDEAAISRLYGGIHYRQAIENGKAEGTLVAQTVIQRVHLKLY